MFCSNKLPSLGIFFLLAMTAACGNPDASEQGASVATAKSDDTQQPETGWCSDRGYQCGLHWSWGIPHFCGWCPDGSDCQDGTCVASATPTPAPGSPTPSAPGLPSIASYSGSIGEIGVSDAWGGGIGLHLGYPRGWGKTPGMVLTASVQVPEGASGTLKFVQVGQSHRQWNLSDGRRCYLGGAQSKSMALWRTDANPYPMLGPGQTYDNYNDPNRPAYSYVNDLRVSGPATVRILASDAPEAKVSWAMLPAPADTTEVIVDEDFETFVVFSSDQTGGEHILGMLTWGWSHKAKKSGGSWSLSGWGDRRSGGWTTSQGHYHSLAGGTLNQQRPICVQ